MRTIVRSLFLALLACLSATCAHAQPAPSRPGAPQISVRIWVEPNELVPASLVMAGCRYWEMFGAACIHVSEPEHANVRIVLNREKCVPIIEHERKASEKGRPIARDGWLKPGCTAKPENAPLQEGTTSRIAATTDRHGTVELFVDCMRELWPDSVRSSGAFAQKHVRHLLAHEIGHAMGVGHVPAECGDPCVDYETTENGIPICGLSVMNPKVGEARVPTVPDAWAFDARNTRRP